MAKKVTPVEQKKMWELYKELGSYAAVGRKMRRNADTVSRHIKIYETAFSVAAAMEEAKK